MRKLRSLNRILLFIIIVNLNSQCNKSNNANCYNLQYEAFSDFINYYVDSLNLDQGADCNISILVNLKSNNGIVVESIIKRKEILALTSKDSTWVKFLNSASIDSVLSKKLSDKNQRLDVDMLQIFHCSMVPISKDSFEKELKEGINGFWRKYYSKNPTSHGILTFSRIIFSLDKKKAIFDLEISHDSLSGSGYTVFMEKDSNKWIVRFMNELWRS